MTELSPVEARERLQDLGVPFSEDSFFDHLDTGDTEIVTLLLSAGIRATARNKEDVSAVVVASKAGRTEVVRMLLERGALLEDVVKAIHSRSKERDVWEKLSSVAPVATIASGLIVAAVGGWFTQSYNKAQAANFAQQQRQDEHLKEIEIVEKMIPHLSESERSKEAALVAISVLTDKTLSTKLAEVYKGDGSVNFLQQLIVSSNSTPAEKSAALEAIVHVLDDNRPAIVKVSSEKGSATGFVADSSSGHVTIVTASYEGFTGPFTVETWDGHSYEARLKNSEKELAYLSVEAPDMKTLKPSKMSPFEGMRIIGVGFIAGRDLNLQVGTIRHVEGNILKATYDGSKRVLAGFGGSPILDSNGDVMGIAYAYQDGNHIIARYTSVN
jgi:hypothetical protein